MSTRMGLSQAALPTDVRHASDRALIDVPVAGELVRARRGRVGLHSRHEADLHTARFAEVGLQASARDAAVHDGCGRQLGQLQDRAVDGMHRRGVSTAHINSRFVLSVTGRTFDTVRQLAQDPVVFDVPTDGEGGLTTLQQQLSQWDLRVRVHWPRVEACGKHLLLHEQHLIANLEFSEFFVLLHHHLLQLGACAKLPFAVNGSRVVAILDVEL
eukprot:scaffold427_cov108-Isochrysis_galbana.AAC.7